MVSGQITYNAYFFYKNFKLKFEIIIWIMYNECIDISYCNYGESF